MLHFFGEESGNRRKRRTQGLSAVAMTACVLASVAALPSACAAFAHGGAAARFGRRLSRSLALEPLVFSPRGGASLNGLHGMFTLRTRSSTSIYTHVRGTRSVIMCAGARGVASSVVVRKFATTIEAARVRVYAISDLHADYKPNMEWIRNLPSKRAQADQGEGPGRHSQTPASKQL